MKVQSQILGTLRTVDSERLGALVRRGLDSGRIGIARETCELLGFRDALGRLQLSGCLKALGVLERSSRIKLSTPRLAAPPPSPGRLEVAPAAASRVFSGNTADPMTLASQVCKMRNRFGIG